MAVSEKPQIQKHFSVKAIPFPVAYQRYQNRHQAPTTEIKGKEETTRHNQSNMENEIRSTQDHWARALQNAQSCDRVSTV